MSLDFITLWIYVHGEYFLHFAEDPMGLLHRLPGVSTAQVQKFGIIFRS